MGGIPKIIHYCWFGRGEKPKIAKRCIKTWKKFCPDYEIVEWNEDNYDVDSSPLFVRQALKERQYAFATDYIRLEVVYNHGGIYLDVDVELLKSLDPLLDNRCYFGFEEHSLDVATGLGFGAEKGTPILVEMMELYKAVPFIRDDGSFDRTVAGTRERNVFLRNGLILDGSEQILQDLTHVYSCEYFCPCSYDSHFLKKTKNTFSIHHYATTWYDRRQNAEFFKHRLKNDLMLLIRFPNFLAIKALGKENYDKLKGNVIFTPLKWIQSFLLTSVSGFFKER